MSLEAALAELTKELKINNELLQKNIASRSEIVQKAEKLAGKATKPSKAAVVEDDEDEDEEPAPKAKKTVEKTEAKKPAKAKAMSAEDAKVHIRTMVGEFLNSVNKGPERDKRKAFVESMLEELGANQVVDIDQSEFPRVAKWLELIEAGKKVNFSADEDEASAKSKKKAVEADDDDEDDAPKAKKKPKKPVEVDDDEDEDDDSDDDDEDEDEE